MSRRVSLSIDRDVHGGSRHWLASARSQAASRGRRRRRARPWPQTTIDDVGRGRSRRREHRVRRVGVGGRGDRRSPVGPARAAASGDADGDAASRAAGTTTRRGLPDASAGVGNVRADPQARRRRARRRRDRRPGAPPRGRRSHGRDAAAPWRPRTPAARPRRVGVQLVRRCRRRADTAGERAEVGRRDLDDRAPSANRSRGDSSSSSPVATIASASAKPRSSKSRACRPQVPRWCGLSQVKTPFAPQVFATPRFPASANARSPSTASVVDHARPRQHDDPAVDAVDLVDRRPNLRASRGHGCTPRRRPSRADRELL